MIDLAPETEALAQRIAEAEHRTVDETVREALKAREASVLTPAAGLMRFERAAGHDAIDRFVRRAAVCPMLDPRSPEEIMDDLGYP